MFFLTKHAFYEIINVQSRQIITLVEQGMYQRDIAYTVGVLERVV